jgi:hypothetical protein
MALHLVRRSWVGVGERRNTIFIVVVLQDKRGNLLNAAEVFNLKILNIDTGFEVLLDMQEQLHKPLRVENSRLKQIGIRRWHVHVHHFRKQHGEPVLDFFVLGVCHVSS